MPTFRGPDGKVIDVPDEQAHSYEARGYTPVGDVAAGAAQNQIAPVDNGITGSIGATLSAGLSGATLGGSDWLLKSALTPGGFKQMAQDRADNPGLAGAAQFAGALVPAVVSGGSITPTGYLSHVAADGIGAAEEVGGAVGAARSLAIAGSEGAIQNAGAYLSDVALGDRDLTAEGMVGALGTGFAFGGGGLVAAHGIAAGTMAARRMFARYAAGGEQAANDARMAWQEQSAKALESFDQAATAAQTKLQEAQLARQQADLARKQASAAVSEAKIAPPPEVAGGARGAGPTLAPQTSPDVEIAGLLHDRAMAATDPQQMAAWDAQNGQRLQEMIAARQAQPAAANPLDALAQAPGVKAYGPETLVRDHGYRSIPGATPAEADLSAKLAEYRDARAAFHDVHAQVDPDLDDVLRGLRIGEPAMPGGVAGNPDAAAQFAARGGNGDPRLEAAMRELIERPDTLGPGGIPVGEFGAPGARGIKVGAELEPKPPTAVEAATGDVTAPGKRRPTLDATPAEARAPEEAVAADAGRLQRGIPERARVVGRYEAAPAPEATGGEPGQPYRPISDEDYLAHRKAFESKITPEEHKAVDAYTGSLYKDVNRALRHGEIRNGREGFISQLDNAVAKSPLHENATLYRGLSGTDADQFRKLEIGDSFEEKAFTSTSSSPEAFKRDVNLHIDVPAGYEAAPVPSSIDEKEWLLRRNTKFVVTGIKDEGASRTVSVRVVDSPRQPVEGMVSTKTGRQPDAPPLRVVKSTNGTIPGQVSGGAASADRAPRQVASEAEFRKMQRAFRTRLTDDEIDQSLRYSREHYDDVNRHLRGHEKAHDVAEAKKIIPALDSMLDKARITEPIVVHRGASMRRVGDLKPGDEYIDPGYQSTAWRPDNVKTFGEAHLVITAPVGTKIAPIASSKGEGEFLIARNTKLRITGREEHPGGGVTLHATVEVPAADRAAATSSPFEPPAARPIEAMSKRELEYAQNDAAEHRRSLQYSGQHESPEFQESSERYNAISKRLDDIKSGASAEPLPPASDLMSQLKGTSAKIGEGSALAEISASSPARAEYVAKRAAKQVEDAAYFRKRAMDLKSGATPDADSFFAELTRPKTWHDYLAKNIQKAMREEGSHAAAMERLKGEWATMQGEGGAQPLAAKRLEMAHDAAVERAATATDPVARREAQAEAQSIGTQMTTVGHRPGAVEDVAAMAPVVHRLEKAAAELTETLGADAPAVAKDHAAAFRKAEDAADSKSMSRAARAADDHAAAQEKTQADDMVGGPSARERAVAVAKRQRAEAEAAYQKSRVAEAEASIGAKRAKQAAGEARSTLPPPPETKPTAQGTGVGNRIIQGAHAIGYAAELGSDLGIPGIPRPHDIPVVGPLLSAYLKYRAFKAAAGRFVGRIPATAETRAAELAARTRDGVARAVDRSLGLVERNPTAVRTAVTIGAIRANEALSRRMVDDGHPDAPTGASVSQLAAVRMREVAAVVANPALITDKVRAESRAIMDPELITALENHLVAMFQHLNDTAPKGPPPNPYTKQEWKPPAADALQWGQRLAVANNPQVAFEMLQAGTLTPPAADTLRVAYAKLFAEAQARIIARASDLKNPVPYRQLMQNALLFNVPLHPSLDPENAAVLRTAHAPSPPAQTAQPQPPQPSIAGSANVDNLYQTTADRRAAR